MPGVMVRAHPDVGVQSSLFAFADESLPQFISSPNVIWVFSFLNHTYGSVWHWFCPFT